jgi:UDP-N-acetylmuramoylalanine--D-glutamate ligase
MDQTHFSGIYNAENILACALVANEMRICSKRTKKYLEAIHGLPHRLEFYREIHGVTFIDDGKSTSSQSLRAGLESFEKPVVLIAGGSDKGDPFVNMESIFSRHIKHAELIGQTRELLGSICDRA